MSAATRAGTRPELSTEGPQRQLTQQSSPELWGRLVFEATRLAHIREGRSAVSPVDSRALLVADRDEPAVPEATLAPGAPVEPAHVHGVHDTSLHLVLPRQRAEQVCADGWGVPHAYGDFGTEILVYGPRDADELALVLGLVRESIAFARGE
ncbi:hypothetical protein [Leifsonia sp. NPDC080035]|uniref:Luciferase domain-containing protein n=1 Tax=Leifsonia sp. NPDC080035 TaxID=3143936 RepID=A0AAU7GEA6_9MICO